MSLCLWIVLSLIPAYAEDEVIQSVPQGTVLQFPGGRTFRVPAQSYLLPERHYDRALIAAKKLDVCEATLKDSQDSLRSWIEVSNMALETCQRQFELDTKLVDEQVATIRTLEIRALTAESKVRDIRNQRNLAWGITGGVVLGVVGASAVALGR
jgi:hypothetical protein